MKQSNDVEKYELEITKMGQNYSLFFLQCKIIIFRRSKRRSALQMSRRIYLVINAPDGSGARETYC